MTSSAIAIHSSPLFGQALDNAKIDSTCSGLKGYPLYKKNYWKRQEKKTLIQHKKNKIKSKKKYLAFQ